MCSKIKLYFLRVCTLFSCKITAYLLHICFKWSHNPSTLKQSINHLSLNGALHLKNTGTHLDWVLHGAPFMVAPISNTVDLSWKSQTQFSSNSSWRRSDVHWNRCKSDVYTAEVQITCAKYVSYQVLCFDLVGKDQVLLDYTALDFRSWDQRHSSDIFHSCK